MDGRDHHRVTHRGQRARSLALAASALVALASTPGAGAATAAQDRGQRRIYVAQEAIPLRVAIVQLAEEAGVAIDLAGRDVGGVIEFSSADGIPMDEAWRLVNEQLAINGSALVRRPTQETLTLVPIEEAARLARLEPDGLDSAHDGFVRILYRAEAVRPTPLADALTELLPEQRTTVTPLEDAGHLAIAGLRADVEQALVALELLDASGAPPVTQEIPVQNRSVVTLGSRLEQVAQKQKAAGREAKGWFLPLPESSSILLVAPEEDIARWETLIAQLDDPGDVATRHYVPSRFTASATAELIEDVLGGTGGEIPGWRLVEDELTGTLIITAPLTVHERIEELLDRLERTTGRAGKQLRSFEILYRDAEEVIELLEGVLDLASDLDERPPAPEPGEGEGAVSPPPRSGPATRSGRGVQLTVDAATNQVLAYAEPQILRQIEALLEQLDTAEPQVLVEATVVSLTAQEMRSLGVELRAAGTVNGALAEAGTFFGLGAPSPSSGTITEPGLAGGVGVILNPGDFSAVVQALRTVSDGRSLSRPRVVTRNHTTAELNSVLETPYAATVSTQVVATTTFGGSSEAGTIITVTPHLTSGDRIRVEYGITLSAFVGEPSDPALPPPRQQTVLQSEALLPDGHTVVLGGLDLLSSGRSETSVPGLGRIPLLGWLFRERGNSRQDTRFFVFIRCDVMRGDSYRALRAVTAPALEAASVPGDVPVLEPRWMR